jgi:hypothetical protein
MTRFVKVHDFSHAEKGNKIDRALRAAENSIS